VTVPRLSLLHGYAMRPATYARLVQLLATRCRVLVPDLFAVRGRWRYSEVLERSCRPLIISASTASAWSGTPSGGGIELGFAARQPDRVVELVFSDTLAASRSGA